MRNLQILLAEDNDADAVLIVMALDEHRLSYDMVRATDGEMAIHIIRNLGQSAGSPYPDIVLLDLNLPRFGGTEVLAEFKKRDACRNIPVVIVTSADGPSDRERLASMGVSHFFHKPNDVGEYMKLGGVVAALAA